MDVERFDTVVIGAVQAGLSAGYHLRGTGRSFVILDGNERIGESWRRRYDSLRLFTPARYVGLPVGLGRADQGRDGRLPRGVRVAVRAPRANGRPCPERPARR